MGSISPTLWVVATPLGNLGDISKRGMEALEKADIVLAEDTRRTGKLLQGLGLSAKKYVSLHDHNEEKRIKSVLEFFEEGKNCALVSDAGTPLMSDPGFRLVKACREAGVRVVPVPGPCAPITALSGCGIAPYPFTFIGFLPRKDGQMRKVLEQYGATGATLVFFERKSRLLDTLRVAFETLGDREFAVCRELTKDYEEFILGNLANFDEVSPDLKGEITVVVGPPVASAVVSEEELQNIIIRELDTGDKTKVIAKRVAANVQGWTVKAVYEKLISIKDLN